MTYKYTRGDLAAMLELAIEHRLPAKVEEWKANLAQGRLTREMRDVFAAFGWISSRQDGRIADEPESPEDKPEPKPVPKSEPVEIREPRVRPGKPEDDAPARAS